MTNINFDSEESARAFEEIERRRADIIKDPYPEGYEKYRSLVIDRALKVLPAELVTTESLGLSTRANRLLKERGIVTLLELVLHSREDLFMTRHCGRKTIDEIEAKVREMGLQLAERSCFV